MDRTFYVLAYDIANDKRRQKIAKCCEAMAERVQYSVFEAYLSEAELKQLLKKTDRIMNAKEDSLRIYVLCEACRKKAATRGLGKVTPPPAVTIV